jgi:hypothetical protein
VNHEEILGEFRRARDDAHEQYLHLDGVVREMEAEQEDRPRVSGKPVLAAVGGRTVEPSVYVPSHPMDAVPTDTEIVAEEERNYGSGMSHEEREGRIKEVCAARNYLIYESCYRVELNRPVLIHPTAPRKTRIHFIEASGQDSATEDFRTAAMRKKGVTVIEVRRANEGDLVEYLSEAS